MGATSVELRHLRYFIAVAEESTLVAAAKRLRIAQPALTRQIHDLEREVGVELFERGAKGVELTPAGDVCLVSARHILHQVDVAVRRARGTSTGVVGRCIICVGPRALASGLIARIIARVHSEYPAIDVVVTEGSAERQWNAIRLLDADIGLGLSASRDYNDLSSDAVAYDIFDAALLSSTHVLAQRPALVLADLRSETFLFWTQRTFAEVSTRQKAEFARMGFKPARTREFADVYSLSLAVAAGQGWTLLPRGATAFAIEGTTIVPLEDFKLPVSLALITRLDEQRPVIRTVVGVMRRVIMEERAAASPGPRVSPEPAVIPPVAEADGEHARDVVLELRHLRYFSAVVEATSFGRAAERLELTQPALSRQVRDLERAIGVDLLERAARGATVTPAGESFFRSARRILDEADALPAEALRARRGMVSRCIVASVPTPIPAALLEVLFKRCGTEMPQTELVVEAHNTPEQPAALRSARVDLGICHASPLTPEDERGLRRERLVNDLVSCALVPVASPLATRSSIEFLDLAGIPFVFPSRAFQPGLYDELFSLFGGRSFSPRIEQTYDGLKTAWAMISDGRGWGIGFESQRAHPPPGTVAVPVAGFAMPWGVDVLYRDNESRTHVLLILDMLHDIARLQDQQYAVA